jgi:hypothetical protein
VHRDDRRRGSPRVRRFSIAIGAGRSISGLRWGDGEPELVLLQLMDNVLIERELCRPTTIGLLRADTYRAAPDQDIRCPGTAR